MTEDLLHKFLYTVVAVGVPYVVKILVDLVRENGKQTRENTKLIELLFEKLNGFKETQGLRCNEMDKKIDEIKKGLKGKVDRGSGTGGYW